MNDQAIRELDEVIRRNPEDATAYLNRGNTYFKKGDYDRAIADYGQAINLAPEDATAYNNRGYAYHEKGDYQQTLANYDRITLRESKAATVYNNRTLYGGDYQQVIADLNEAIRLKPDHAMIYLNRGDVYHTIGDLTNNYAEAIDNYDSAVRLCPNYETDFIDRKFVFGGEEEVKRAIQLLNSRISNPPKSAADYYYTGVRQLFTNDRLSARRCFEIALKLGYNDREKIEQHLENLKSEIVAVEYS